MDSGSGQRWWWTAQRLEVAENQWLFFLSSLLSAIIFLALSSFFLSFSSPNLHFFFRVSCPTCFLSLLMPLEFFSFSFFLVYIGTLQTGICLYHLPPHTPHYLPLYIFGLDQHFSTRRKRFWPIYIFLYTELYLGDQISREEKELSTSGQTVKEKHSSFIDLQSQKILSIFINFNFYQIKVYAHNFTSQNRKVHYE